MPVCICVRLCAGFEAAEPVPGVWAAAGWESLRRVGVAARECNSQEAIKGKVRKEINAHEEKKILTLLKSCKAATKVLFII